MVPKIHLSQAEMQLVNDAEIILTKNRIIQKVIQLLQTVQDDVLLQENNPHTIAKGPKISKGENYLGLPWVVLDHPRESKDQNLFFIRSMFWWGNFFSSTLQISGSYKNEFLPSLIASHNAFAANEYYVGVHADPWLHHFEQDNFIPIKQLSHNRYTEILNKQQHIKIAAKWPLSEWNSAAEHLLKSRKFIMDQLPTQAVK